jgi:hypothetical protein
MRLILPLLRPSNPFQKDYEPLIRSGLYKDRIAILPPDWELPSSGGAGEQIREG